MARTVSSIWAGRIGVLIGGEGRGESGGRGCGNGLALAKRGIDQPDEEADVPTQLGVRSASRPYRSLRRVPPVLLSGRFSAAQANCSPGICNVFAGISECRTSDNMVAAR
jgi:hypothetical protein